ncbi:PLD-like domain-containing protein [Singulisphaera sp. GP187]|uniref:phospholipase D-like domain-containing protein n=1 Tax=Singulisphaera sp. GP187 TaxID=1882752 RepID=UPI00092763BD|nr:phospholipase D-like domain-containing protein [Singulisphaera sp. GP187]SIN80127.1 PLD-like domain-containing protein [Singulisphaera sp. GP187]
MTKDQIKSTLALTLEDHQLSRSEREALFQVFEPLRDAVEPLELRRLAFEVARDALRDSSDGGILAWLEALCKVLDRLEPKTEVRVAEAYFSPQDECWRRIVHLLDGARQHVDICVFTITDDRLSEAIVAAHRRGVAVRVLTDNEKAEDEGSDIDRLHQAGVPLRTDRSLHHMHHKFALFDNRLLLNGSYNWTRGAALYNEENFAVTDERRLISAYIKAFEQLWNRLS